MGPVVIVEGNRRAITPAYDSLIGVYGGQGILVGLPLNGDVGFRFLDDFGQKSPSMGPDQPKGVDANLLLLAGVRVGEPERCTVGSTVDDAAAPRCHGVTFVDDEQWKLDERQGDVPQRQRDASEEPSDSMLSDVRTIPAPPRNIVFRTELGNLRGVSERMLVRFGRQVHDIFALLIEDSMLSPVWLLITPIAVRAFEHL